MKIKEEDHLELEEMAEGVDSPVAPLEERLPMIAIIGRPNVGKSTLFNRLMGSRRALVHDKPGMTRDRRIDRIEWDGRSYICVDTGGFDVALEDPLLENVAEQARIAIQEADLIILLTAVGEVNHPAEQEMIRILRRSGKPSIVTVNKCDNEKMGIQAQEFYQYGFDHVYPVSALHGYGVGEMMEGVAEKLDAIQPQGREYVSGGIAIAVVGRQNVGKSTLINKLLGEERVIACDLPGTTRDSIDTTLKTEAGDVFTLIDTAGIRRRGKIERGIEKLSVLSSMIAIRRADVAVIVIDATAGLTAQDAHIAGYCVEEGRGCILLVNKWDAVEKDHKTADLFTKTLQREWGFLKYAPVLYVSALTGQRVSKALDLAKRVHENAGRRVPTPELNERLISWTDAKSPPVQQNRVPKFKYIAQVAVHPPTFVIFVNDPAIVHFSYQRYLVNCLRSEFDFEGTPIKLILRRKK